MHTHHPTQPSEPFVYADIDSREFASWIALHKYDIEANKLKYGAVVFKDLNLPADDQSVAKFEAFAQALSKEGLFNENGEHPHINISGYVSKPVHYSPKSQLLWHSENSFNHTWPLHIWFACLQLAENGGQTTLVNNRKVYELIPKNIREKFVSKGVLYVRNYAEGAGLDWRTVFQTDSKQQVEAVCKENKIDFEWTHNDSLRTMALRPAALKHPKTGELCWFNQAQHWHIACLETNTRAAIQELYAEQDYPRACYYGDKTSIADEDMHAILDVYRNIEFAPQWEQGSMLMLDNVLCAHGRNAYTGERKLLVALGDMQSYPS